MPVSSASGVVHGSCLCGGVAFAVAKPLISMGNCHCSMCRHQHGTAFSTYAQAHAAGLTISRGALLVTSYASSATAERQFCGRCGSKLFYRASAMPTFVWIAAGAFDDDPEIQCSYHIFTASRASWFEITDDLPQHAAFPDDAGH